MIGKGARGGEVGLDAIALAVSSEREAERSWQLQEFVYERPGTIEEAVAAMRGGTRGRWPGART